MADTPEAIGNATRELVERQLGILGFDVQDGRLLERVRCFAESVALWGSRINLTSAPENPSELAFHIVDSLMPLVLAARPEGAILARLLTARCSVLDLGAGAGFPGLILAAASPARFTLLERRRKRASFLQLTAAAMGLANVTIDPVHRGPAELTPDFDIVVGRAFARPARFYSSAAAALRPDGVAILYASREQPLDLPTARAAGLDDPTILPYAVLRGSRPVARRLIVLPKPN